MDLDIHLDRGDAVMRTGHLEVHVAEEVFQALDVGQDDVVVIGLAGHQTDGDAADHCLDRDAGSHQRHAGGAGGGHGG